MNWLRKNENDEIVQSNVRERLTRQFRVNFSSNSTKKPFVNVTITDSVITSLMLCTTEYGGTHLDLLDPNTTIEVLMKLLSATSAQLQEFIYE